MRADSAAQESTSEDVPTVPRTASNANRCTVPDASGSLSLKGWLPQIHVALTATVESLLRA